MRPKPSSNDSPSFDPRSIANLVIRLSVRKLTNLELQKLVYFVHAAYLARTGQELVSGYFEAWTHGPVHPAIYASFKEFGAKQIDRPAFSKDIRTGELREIPEPTNKIVLSVATNTLKALENLSAGQLVRLSHAPNGPWDVVFRRSKREHMLGLRISNDLIRNNYQSHWLVSDKLEGVEEPDEDAPLTYHRFG